MKPQAVLSLILALACPVLSAEEKPMEKESTVSVQGHSELLATPDEAVVRLGVTHSAANAGQAQKLVNEQMQAVVQAIRDLGVSDEAIKTTQITLSPEYAARRGEGPVLTGYRATNTVSIRLQRLDMAGRVFDAATEVGGNEIEGIQFDLRDDTELRLRALGEAVRSARAKAAVMAEALGMRLGRVIEVSESHIEARPVYLQQARAMEAASSAPVSPGQISVTAMVTLRCALVP